MSEKFRVIDGGKTNEGALLSVTLNKINSAIKPFIIFDDIVAEVIDMAPYSHLSDDALAYEVELVSNELKDPNGDVLYDLLTKAHTLRACLLARLPG